jgi:hypothetical protein
MPDVEDLEFPPPLAEVWNNLLAPAGWYHLSCINNLIIQFKDDPIDQELRLVRALLAAHDAAGGSPKNAMVGAITAPEDDKDCHRDRTPAVHSVKFARLSGGHLTPVTLWGNTARMIPGGGHLPPLFLVRLHIGVDQRRTTRGTTRELSHQKWQRDIKDVADTVASYIRSLKAR